MDPLIAIRSKTLEDGSAEVEEVVEGVDRVFEESEELKPAQDASGIRELSLGRSPKLWAVGGGKGGVGKSLICANFALSLAYRGRRVIAIDLDLGGSNLHTCLGVAPPKIGLGDWICGRFSDLADCAVETRVSGLKIISGSQDPVQIAKLMDSRRQDLLEALRALDVDDVLIDLGAGSNDFTVEFFNYADEGLLSILPEPTSVENAYRFIKSVFYKRLKQTDVGPGIREVIDAAMDQKNVLGIRTPADLFAILERLDPEAAEVLKKAASELTPSIVMNQVRTQVDVDVGRAICSVCRRYFGLNVSYAGYLDYDNSVWKAVRNKKAVIQEYPHSALANRIEHLTKALLGETKGMFP